MKRRIFLLTSIITYRKIDSSSLHIKFVFFKIDPRKNVEYMKRLYVLRLIQFIKEIINQLEFTSSVFIL